MDFRASDSYLRTMFARIVTMLFLLAFAVITTAASTHAARMSVTPGDTAYAAMMMQDAGSTAPACAHHRPCRSADVGLCGFVCASLSVLPTMPVVDTGPAFGTASHGIPAAAIHASRMPGLTERPPKLRLL